ncbi:enoyl-CoA hydratase/isomerase family protein [Lentzea sp. NPDC005914]|uniref:enoyl-CoA hydratase/isomerase family protein n=1 Tax=Lentzea sp. NPDC005914 TaxID=3154572 RepID=UPI0033D79D2D
MASPLVVSERSDGYLRVTFDNPPLNLMSPETMIGLREVVDRLEADPAVKVVVFDSADEEFFLAHFDIVRGGEVPAEPGPSGLPYWADIVTRLTRAPFVSIAEIRGRARGIGSEFALACDMRFASRERAVFCQPEVGIGLIPGGGALEVLPRMVGRSRALEIALGAEDFDAELAERYGWINRALPDAELATFVDRLARRIASFEQAALVATKALIDKRAGVPSDDERRETSQIFRESGTWPGTRKRIGEAVARGLQQRGDFELNLGARLGPAD